MVRFGGIQFFWGWRWMMSIHNLGGIALAKEYLTPLDVAKMFMVTPDTVRDWVRQGLLQTQTSADDVHFSLQQLHSFARLRGLDLPPLENHVQRLLIVDDDKCLCHSLAEQISAIDNQLAIETAYDGFEAGWKVESFNPNLILLDLMMPGQDGYTVCRQLKNDPQTWHIRIIAMASFISIGKREKIKNAGAEMCLAKPIDVSALVANIGLVDGHSLSIEPQPA